ncbi:hypothetical protein acdb102_10880 [Acidothermaceae bacterium B102]|nr:hypothetical protein acdb102_10880 [Acidothermaceae bacterium B102]
MIKRFLAVMAASVAIVGGSAGAALADYPPAMQAGAVSATTVAPGGQVDFAGDGFAAGSKVVVSVNKAVYATVVAGSTVANSALGSRTAVHFQNAAFRSVALPAATPAAASFSVKVTLQAAGSNVLVGAGVAPDGSPHVVTATVVVDGTATAVEAASPASGLPFTGSDVIIPGVIIGAAMMAGGFLLLTTVKARKAGARS